MGMDHRALALHRANLDVRSGEDLTASMASAPTKRTAFVVPAKHVVVKPVVRSVAKPLVKVSVAKTTVVAASASKGDDWETF